MSPHLMNGILMKDMANTSIHHIIEHHTSVSKRDFFVRNWIDAIGVIMQFFSEIGMRDHQVPDRVRGFRTERHDPFMISDIHARAGIEECSNRSREFAAPYGDMEWGSALLIFRMKFRTVCHQILDRFGATVHGGAVQRCLTMLVSLVDIGVAMLDEKTDHIEMSTSCGSMQHPGLDSRAHIEQRFDSRGSTALERECDGCIARYAPGIHTGPILHDPSNGWGITRARGVHEVGDIPVIKGIQRSLVRW
jgi:hypothetical protein